MVYEPAAGTGIKRVLSTVCYLHIKLYIAINISKPTLSRSFQVFCFCSHLVYQSNCKDLLCFLWSKICLLTHPLGNQWFLRSSTPTQTLASSSSRGGWMSDMIQYHPVQRLACCCLIGDITCQKVKSFKLDASLKNTDLQELLSLLCSV